MPATGDDDATITNWVNDLSFAEAHAMTYGFVHGVTIVAAYFFGQTEVSLTLVLAAFALNGWLKTDKTKETPGVQRVINRLPNGIVGQIRGELHYYDGALLIGILVGAVASGVTLVVV